MSLQPGDLAGPSGCVRAEVVVIGNGMVGHNLVQSLRIARPDDLPRTVVFGGEAHPAYDRVALSSYVESKDAESLFLGQYPTEDVEIHLGDPVVHIDREAKTVRSASGLEIGYEILVLATGSVPFVPPLEGSDAFGCHVYRTLEDIDRIRAASAQATTGVVVGGGLLGLEAANALRLFNLDTHVVEMAPRLMPIQIDEGGGALLRREIEELGIAVHLATSVAEIVVDGGEVRGVRLSDGTAIDAQVVVFAVGVRPEDSLAREAGLAIGERGGVLVDRTCQTSDPAIFAIGECAALDGRCYGLVAPGYAMASVVAGRICGADATVSDPDTSTKLKMLGVEVASFGDCFGETPGSLEVVYADHVSRVYKKLVVSDDAKTILGGVLVGDSSSYGLLRAMAISATEIQGGLEQFLVSASAEADRSAPSGAVTVCSCHNVTAERIVDAIGAGCEDIPAIKSATKAATGCGSCIQLVNKILGSELARCGKERSKALCEHFNHSRQELFDLVAVQGLDSFIDISARYGNGSGCDICKPVVASILATRPGSHPLDPGAAALQDTNDHVMANLQRDGSYSVVPRIPGGEVTPQGLITLGSVAAEFGLYTKITGGQRVDLFGARIDQLPDIWRRLVAAGFESGHAYGKAVRTVKSCVGSTWCRYGVQDSTTLAIALELRYRGLRSPHKVKAGVSGCARECAEARSKDIGVIATDAGWNLYVGGNGGFSPRHAELLATDLDEETLVRYIDRFLVYYIRTADRLQRTASWIESLEGGLAHVAEVVIDDKLGLAHEMEDYMARHVENYRDEWAATLEDEEKLGHFVSFVNAPDRPDPSLVFVRHRSQHRPATPQEREALSGAGARGGVR